MKNSTRDYIKSLAKDLKNPDLDVRVLALGMGMQSTALYLMSSMGLVDRCDIAVFSDPMSEHYKTYELLEWILEWQKDNDGVPIEVVKKDLYKDIVTPMSRSEKGFNRYASIPAHIRNEDGSKGISIRSCTVDYKIAPVTKVARKFMGLKKGQRLRPFELWLGITTEEIQRMKLNQNKKIFNRYPLIELEMSRSDCMAFMEDNKFPIPVKSACVFCPYHSDKFWLELKKENGDAWKKSVALDYKMREREDISLKGIPYLHKSLKPLDEVYLQENQIDMFDNECEGHCGL